MTCCYPTASEIAHAVERAIHHRRALARRNPQYCFFPAAALAERITGEPRPPRPLGNGWWIVGVVIDDTDMICDEYSVLLLPGQGALDQPRIATPPPSRFYYRASDGAGPLDSNAHGDA